MLGGKGCLVFPGCVVLLGKEEVPGAPGPALVLVFPGSKVILEVGNYLVLPGSEVFLVPWYLR